MILLVDVGNSRLKWTQANAGLLQPTLFMDYRQADFLECLREFWLHIAAPRQLAIASVSENAVTLLLLEMARALWPGIEVIIPRASQAAFNVKNAYAQPERLGVDRWLALLAAHRYYPGDTCIVDCGTAITIDFIETDGKHLGGLISPGLLLMKKSLAQNTAALPFNEDQADTQLAVVTEAAINNGTLLAAAGLVEATLARQPKVYRLVLSGGDAETVARYLAIPSIVDSDLVFKGMLNYCRNENAS
ncbi:Pantothenate kinase type III, CoaX-like (EC 2.7.1.33) [Methylomonas albis]|uniref:Type III pantothenate kinase n=1 Tax=Methylomonas albis TaxID=1854563 RepID=A0ABR9D253_9GAMM|nr:type III pantothenate kinase [Methylomonas albis]MBD9356886.1 type III pantothenate kinase [Methylomonas albis]CAD6880067.1 Pantothenate kinase type III, CoaX-like (EC 2.7.1.33) [Methylomonas albis]